MSDIRRLRWLRDRQDTPQVKHEEIFPSAAWTEDPKFHYLLIDLPEFRKGDIKLQIDESGAIAISGDRKIGNIKHVHFQRVFKVPSDSDVESITMKLEDKVLQVTIPKVVKEDKKEVLQRLDEIAACEFVEEKKEEQPKSPKSENTEQASNTEKKMEQGNHPEDGNDYDQGKKKMEQGNHPEDGNDHDQGKKKIVQGNHPEDENDHDQGRKKMEQGNHPQDVNDRDQGRNSSDQSETLQKSLIEKVVDKKGFLIAIISFTLGVLLSHKFQPHHS